MRAPEWLGDVYRQGAAAVGLAGRCATGWNDLCGAVDLVEMRCEWLASSSPAQE